MLFKTSIVSFLGVSTSLAAASILQNQNDNSALSKLRCGAVNFMVTAFLPQAHATAFCSAYLQIPEKSYTSTATVTASASTITETTSQIVPTYTKVISSTYLSTSTTTIDLWVGKPACSTIPRFDWVRENRDSFKPIEGILEQACGCLAIPASTQTIMAFTTTIPTSTITQGIIGRTTVTSTHVKVAVETHTKYVHLIDRSNQMSTDEDVVYADRQIALSFANHPLGLDLNQSRLSNSSDGGVVRRSAPLLGRLHLADKMGIPVMS